MEKTCTKCGRTMDITMFSKHCKSKDGYRTYCKECAKAYQSKWYTNNREEENASRRSKYDYVKESERYESRKESVLLKKKEWRANNKDKQTLQSEKRRAREANTSNSLTQEEWEYIKVYFENKCAYCGKDLSLERDHVIALTKGGGLEYGNIVPACKSCNSSKGNKDLLSGTVTSLVTVPPGQKRLRMSFSEHITDVRNYFEIAAFKEAADGSCAGVEQRRMLRLRQKQSEMRCNYDIEYNS